MQVYFFITCGFLLSLYALYIEEYKPKKPLCDINKSISCTKAFFSSYGKVLFFPNSLYGVLFYVLLGVVLTVNMLITAKILSTLALIGSVFLAYISYVKMRNFCLVCTGIYIINLAIFIIIF